MIQIKARCGCARSLLKAAPGPTPSRLKTIAAGQKPVNDAWMRLSPTKAVSSSQ